MKERGKDTEGEGDKERERDVERHLIKQNLAVISLKLSHRQIDRHVATLEQTAIT